MVTIRRSSAISHVGNLTLDRDRREAFLGEQQLALTFQEFEVLSVLLLQQNAVIPHTSLCRSIWGRAGQAEVKRLGVVISNLRRKLATFSPYTIETVRSRGYGIVLGEASESATPDPLGVHDWHSPSYAQAWSDRQDDEARVYLRQVTHLLPFDPEEPIRVLDIGAGYGALTRLILDAYPHSTVVVHDYSEPMLRQARRYLGGVSDAVTFVRGDLLRPDWDRDISGEFDAVVSSIAIHNLRYKERIGAVYRDVHRLVAPGGCFLNADYVYSSGARVEGARQHQALMDQRLRLRESMGFWQPLPAVADAVETPDPAPPAAPREMVSLQDHIHMLQAAGFDEVECFWHDGKRALVGGFK